MITRVFLILRKFTLTCFLLSTLFLFPQACICRAVLLSFEPGYIWTSENGLESTGFDWRIDGVIEIDPETWEVHIEWGWNRFKIEGLDENFDITNFSPSIRYKFKAGKLNPYLLAGPGLYMPEEGDSKLGIKIGLGVDYRISNHFYLNAGTNFNNVFLVDSRFANNDKNFSFQVFQTGLLFRLK